MDHHELYKFEAIEYTLFIYFLSIRFRIVSIVWMFEMNFTLRLVMLNVFYSSFITSCVLCGIVFIAYKLWKKFIHGFKITCWIYQMNDCSSRRHTPTTHTYYAALWWKYAQTKQHLSLAQTHCRAFNCIHHTPNSLHFIIVFVCKNAIH